MNYREKIRKAIECPQFGNETRSEVGDILLALEKVMKICIIEGKENE